MKNRELIEQLLKHALWLDEGMRIDNQYAAVMRDAAVALESCGTRVEPEPEWQPIDSCPNGPTEPRVWVACGNFIEQRFPDGNRWRDEKGKPGFPTHWMHVDIPAPPEAA